MSSILKLIILISTLSFGHLHASQTFTCKWEAYRDMSNQRFQPFSEGEPFSVRQLTKSLTFHGRIYVYLEEQRLENGVRNLLYIWRDGGVNQIAILAIKRNGERALSLYYGSPTYSQFAGSCW